MVDSTEKKFTDLSVSPTKTTDKTPIKNSDILDDLGDLHTAAVKATMAHPEAPEAVKMETAFSKGQPVAMQVQGIPRLETPIENGKAGWLGGSLVYCWNSLLYGYSFREEDLKSTEFWAEEEGNEKPIVVCVIPVAKVDLEEAPEDLIRFI